jgi:hypothetical protein
MVWLREVKDSMGAAIFDGGAVASNGNEGIRACSTRAPSGRSAMAGILVAVLGLQSRDVMPRTWTACRKRLKDGLGHDVPGVGLVSYTRVMLRPSRGHWIGMGGRA